MIFPDRSMLEGIFVQLDGGDSMSLAGLFILHMPLPAEVSTKGVSQVGVCGIWSGGGEYDELVKSGLM